MMNVFFSSQFGYCPPVWMLHNRRYNNKINCLDERMLRIAYKDYKSSFAELLSEDKSLTVHHRNVQKLAIEMYKVKNELCPKTILDLFKEVTHPYNLRNSLICGSYKIKTVRYGTKTITYLDRKIWSIIPDVIRSLRHKKHCVKKSSYENQIVVHVAFAKNILQMLASLIFHEFRWLLS